MTLFTSVLVSHSSVSATRPRVPLVEERRVAFPEDEVASLDYGVASLDYGVASLDDGVTSMEDNSVASLKDDGVALLKDDGVTSLGNNSTDGRAVSPSLMGRIKPIGEDWRPTKEYLLGLGEHWEWDTWDYSNDSEDDHLSQHIESLPSSEGLIAVVASVDVQQVFSRKATAFPTMASHFHTQTVAWFTSLQKHRTVSVPKFQTQYI